MNSTNPVSSEIVEIQNLLINGTQSDGSISIPADKAGLIVKRLNVLARLALNLEDEVAIYRVQSTKNASAATLNDYADEYLMEAADDNVVSIADFSFLKAGNDDGAA